MENFVGCCKLDIEDSMNKLTFPTLVMFPTQSTEEKTMFGPFEINVAVGAPPVENRSFSLVVISHGNGSSNMVFRDLAHYLAKNGFIVCLPEHPANNVFDNSLEYTYENMQRRPRHISLVIDTIISHTKFKNIIQANNVTVIGHSVGGYTALAIAGGKPHTQYLVDFCNQSDHRDYPYWTKIIRDNNLPKQSINVVPDDRVRRLIVLAPDVSLFMQEDALVDIKIPVLMMIAEKDLWSHEIIEAVKSRISEHSNFDIRLVPNAGHYSFISHFPVAIRDKVGESAKDPVGFDRIKFQKHLQKEVLAFIVQYEYQEQSQALRN